MVKSLEYFTNSFSQTKKLGEILAKETLKEVPPTQKAFILGLEGDLGGGKTTFLQGFARALGIKQKILSPTFVILKRFKIPRSRASSLRDRQDLGFKYFYHLDCYRIQTAKEILNLGLKKIISDPKNIIAIEWSERIRRILPKEATILKFYFIDKNKRKIVIKSKYGRVRCRYCW